MWKVNLKDVEKDKMQRSDKKWAHDKFMKSIKIKINSALVTAEMHREVLCLESAVTIGKLQ